MPVPQLCPSSQCSVSSPVVPEVTGENVCLHLSHTGRLLSAGWTSSHNFQTTCLQPPTRNMVPELRILLQQKPPKFVKQLYYSIPNSHNWKKKNDFNYSVKLTWKAIKIYFSLLPLGDYSGSQYHQLRCRELGWLNSTFIDLDSLFRKAEIYLIFHWRTKTDFMQQFS